MAEGGAEAVSVDGAAGEALAAALPAQEVGMCLNLDFQLKRCCRCYNWSSLLIVVVRAGGGRSAVPAPPRPVRLAGGGGACWLMPLVLLGR